MADQLPGAQGRIAFAWLVWNRHRAAPREELATAIWGERVPGGAGPGNPLSSVEAPLGDRT